MSQDERRSGGAGVRSLHFKALSGTVTVLDKLVACH